MKMESFVLTLTVNSKPIVLHFTGGPDNYMVSARNDKNFSPFSVVRDASYWRISSDAPESIRSLENKLSVMINGCTEIPETG